MTVDAVLPLGVSALMPNLKLLALMDCVLTPAAKTTPLDAACTRLQAAHIGALSAQQPPGPVAAQPLPSLQQLATAQLRQLAKLPSLRHLALRNDSCPTLFLVALATQLTSLHLDIAYRDCLPDTHTPTPEWRSTLQHVARCTALEDVVMPCATAEELGVLAPALRRLRALQLYDDAEGADGDAMVEALLALPHLTTLHWDNASMHTFQRWHNDSPCRWETLTLGGVTAPQLARLPLHSLRQPVRWRCLSVPRGGATLQDVRAAVANVTQRCPAGFRWEALDGGGGGGAHLPRVLFRAGGAPPARAADPVPGALRALGPLLAGLAEFGVAGVAWDAARVEALGEALPRTCARLRLFGEEEAGNGLPPVPREALEQLARSLPWLRVLELDQQRVAPDDVGAYVRLAKRGGVTAAAAAVGGSQGGQGKGGWAGLPLALREVVVIKPPRAGFAVGGTGMREHRRTWNKAAKGNRDGVTLRVEW